MNAIKSKLQQATRKGDQLKLPVDTDQRFNEMNSTLLQMTRERDQMIVERDEAVSLTEDMEREICCLSQELDYFTNAASGTTCTTKRRIERRIRVMDDNGTVPNEKKKQRLYH
jgi:hypothetical protein